MTTEEAQALAKGDVVYWRSSTHNWRFNALADGRDVELTRSIVSKVTAKRVHTTYGSFDFENVMSKADGLAAIEAFRAREAKRADDARRVKEAVARVARLGFDANVYFCDLRLSAKGPDACERLADMLELAQRAMALRAELSAALQVEDAPAILLPLSVAQAERVLAALKGGER